MRRGLLMLALLGTVPAALLGGQTRADGRALLLAGVRVGTGGALRRRWAAVRDRLAQRRRLP